MYNNQKYNISSLEFSAHLIPISGIENSDIGKIQNQLINILQSINHIVQRRSDSINSYRVLDKERHHFLHKQSFDRGNFSKEIKEIQKKQSPLLWSIKIDTEIYFVYCRILLDSISELIFFYEKSLPDKTKHNFANLYNHIVKKGCKDNFLREIFLDKMKWYISMIKLPRDTLFVHEIDTSGIGFADHGVDFNIGKLSNNYHDKPFEKILHNIISNHEELSHIRKDSYIHPLMREIIRHFDCLNDSEISSIDKISGRFAVFPYIIDVHLKMQSFLNSIESWIKHRNLKETGMPF